MKFIFVLIAIIVVGFMSFNVVVGITDASKCATLKDCTVKKLVQQSLMKGSNSSINTEIRYLVITDKETFICESSFLNSKFDNSNIFFNLKENTIYTFKVSGVGKTIFTDYRNILEVYEQ